MQLYSLEAVDKLINHYLSRGGNAETIVEGCLGYGTMVLSALGFKTAVIQERYLNEWSSAHTIRMYNKMPKKYGGIGD